MLLHGKDGGIGFGSAWTENGTGSGGVSAASDLFIQTGSLAFGDLATNGHHTRSDTNLNLDIMSRTITSTLDGTVGDTGEIWFSFLANRLQNNNNAGREGLAITSGAVSSAQFDLINPAGLHGFGIASTESGSPGGLGAAYTAWGWNGTSFVKGTASLTVPVNGTQTNLFVGRIEYGVGEDGKDVFSFYNYLLNNGSVIGGTLDFVTSIEVDVDESLLNTMNLTRQVNTAYDEIRIGATLADVVPAAELPSADTFQVIITPNGNDFDFTWASLEDKVYDLVTSTDLADPIADWPVYDDGVTTYDDIAATPPFNTLEAVPGDGPRRFFAVVEKDAPPPAE